MGTITGRKLPNHIIIRHYIPCLMVFSGLVSCVSVVTPANRETRKHVRQC